MQKIQRRVSRKTVNDMRSFITKHYESGLKVTFKYDLNGVLRFLEFEGENWNAEKVKYIMQKMARHRRAILLTSSIILSSR